MLFFRFTRPRRSCQTPTRSTKIPGSHVWSTGAGDADAISYRHLLEASPRFLMRLVSTFPSVATRSGLEELSLQTALGQQQLTSTLPHAGRTSNRADSAAKSSCVPLKPLALMDSLYLYGAIPVAGLIGCEYADVENLRRGSPKTAATHAQML
eukprot:gene30957-12131_t